MELGSEPSRDSEVSAHSTQLRGGGWASDLREAWQVSGFMNTLDSPMASCLPEANRPELLHAL